MRIRRIAPLVLLVAVLAGCTPAPTVPTAAPTTPVVETPSATPTPQPTQEPETGLVQPAQVFDGDCDNLMAEADVSDALGEKVTLSSDTAIDVTSVLVWQSGGITCRWRGVDIAKGLTLSAAPSEAVGSLEKPLVCAVGHVDSPALTCGLASTASGIVVTGLAFLGTADSPAAKKKAAARVVTLTKRVTENSTPSMAAPLPIPAEDAWANPGSAAATDPPSCVDIDAAITSDKFMGGPPRPKPFAGGGGDVYFSPIAADLMGSTSSEAWKCVWQTERTRAQVKSGLLSSFSSATVGGGAWVLDLVAQETEATEVSVQGADRAYRVPYDGGSVQIWAASGPNLVLGNYPPGPKDKNYISLTLVIDALNAL